MTFKQRFKRWENKLYEFIGKEHSRQKEQLMWNPEGEFRIQRRGPSGDKYSELSACKLYLKPKDGMRSPKSEGR